ncbi:hypothetical protein ACOME3_002328 [Neoechinorhynchus agilis]
MALLMSFGDEELQKRRITIEEVLVNQQQLMKMLLENRQGNNADNRINITGFRSYVLAKEEWAGYEAQPEKHFEGDRSQYPGCNNH